MAFKLPQPRELLPLLFPLVLLAPYLFTLIKRVDDQTPPRATRIWLLVLAALALVYIYPRWSTRHLSVAFPFIAAMSGIAFADLVGRQPVRRHARLVGILVAVWWAFHAVGLVTRASMQTAARTYPGYSDVGELAQKLNSRVPSAGTLALLPADEGNLNLYYLMQREPPRYIFYNYPWYLEERLVRRWLASVKNEPPAAVIYFPGRWDIERYAPELLDYTREHYRVTSVFNWQGNRVEVFEPVR